MQVVRCVLKTTGPSLKVVVQGSAAEFDVGHFIGGGIGQSLLLLLLLSLNLSLLLLLSGSLLGSLLVLLALLLLLSGRHLLIVGIEILGSEGELLGSLLLELLLQLLRLFLLLSLLVVLLRCLLGVVVLGLLIGIRCGVLDLLSLGELLLLLVLEIGVQGVAAEELTLELTQRIRGRRLGGGLSSISLGLLLQLLLLLLGKGTSSLDQGGTGLLVVSVALTTVVPGVGLLQGRRLQGERVHVGLLTNRQLGVGSGDNSQGNDKSGKELHCTRWITWG